MSERPCVVCGKPFVASFRGLRTTCSETCRAARDVQVYGAKHARRLAMHPRNASRWTAGDKARLVEAVKAGAMTKDQVCAEHDISGEEFDAWCAAHARSGIEGLRIRNIKQGRVTC